MTPPPPSPGLDDALFRALVQESADAFFVLDLDGRFREVNEEAARGLGYARSELLELSLPDIAPDVAGDALRALIEEPEPGSPVRPWSRHRRRDGSVFPVDLSIRRVTIDGEDHVVVTARDVSERVRKETALGVRIHLADLLPTRTTFDLVHAALDEARGATESTFGLFCSIDVETGQAVLEGWSTDAGQRSLGDGVEHLEIEEGSVWDRAIREGRTLVRNVSTGVLLERPRAGRPESVPRVVVAPVLRESRPVALLAVAGRATEYGDADAALLAEIADGAWDVIEHKKALEALAATERRYQTTVATSPDGFWVSSRDGRIIEVNETYSRLTGYSRDELLGMSVARLEAPDRRDHRRRHEADFRKQGWARFDARHVAKDGRLLDFEVTSTFMEESEIFVTHLRDTTEERGAERALRESESRYRSVVENTSDIPHSIDAEGMVRFIGPQIARYGIDPRSAAGRDFLELVHETDRAHVGNEMSRSLATGEPFQVEFRITGRDGESYWFEERGQVIWAGSGEVAGVSGMLRDVSDRVRMERELRSAQMQYSDFINASHDLVTYWKLPPGVSVDDAVEEQIAAMYEAVCLDSNRPGWEGFGRERLEEVVGQRYVDLITEPTMDEPFRRFIQDGYRLLDVEGSEVTERHGRRYYLLTWHGVVEDGLLTHIWSSQKDITARKKAEQSLRESESRLKELANSVTDPFFALDSELRFTFWNRGAEVHFGFTDDEVLGRSYLELPIDEEQEWMADRYAEVIATGHAQGFRVHVPVERPEFVFDVTVYPSGDGVVVYSRDVTEQERSEDTIRRLVEVSSRKFGVELFESMATELARAVGADYAFIGRFSKPDRIRTVVAVADGKPMPAIEFDLAGTPCEAVLKEGVCSYPEAVATRFPEDRLLTEMRADGYSGVPLFASDGSLLGIMVALFTKPQTDTRLVESLLQIFSARAGSELERLIAEAELRDSEERLRLATQAGRIGIWSYDLVEDRLEWDETMCELYGVDPLGPRRGLALWLDHLHPEDRASAAAAFRASLQADGEPFDAEFRVVRPDDGQVRRLRGLAGIVRTADGTPVRAVGTNWDVTQQRRLEAQLAQSRKMEAIGTLAGGIAHDFNNILQAILGYAQLAAQHEGPHRDDVKAVLEAGERARELVAQILTFSRSSPAEIQPVQLQPIVKETTKLLRASLPSTIELKTQVAAEAEAVLADPTQLHQVVMNLATNAYHAMRDGGGTLTVSLQPRRVTASEADRNVDLSPGRYTALVIEDTGSGMDRETLNRMFEPYFTTRGHGEGTGLGLAIVHSVVADAGGAIVVESWPGEGTTFEILLPATEAEAEAGVASGSEHSSPHGTGRILFVDDEPAIGDVARRALESFGYEVAVFQAPMDALEAFRAAPESFDVLVTDFTMPRMTGLDLARAVHGLRPEMPIVLCSGFTHGIGDAHTREAGVVDVLDKPFPPSRLGWAVRRALGGAASGGTAAGGAGAA